ncbi:MAG TPA: hypothetical protein VHY31_13750 [Streptosporangiaceae bacterium]|jgi:nicotinamidase-related amidase|nr:hypothetical protein [Streptosporangiaceae bacterium]
MSRALIVIDVQESFRQDPLWGAISDGVTDLLVCGIRTEQCCETTARLASDFG